MSYIGRTKAAAFRVWGAALAIAVVAAGIVALSPAPPAAAASFNPGNIISDANFYDGAAMSEAQIQSFLVSKGSVLASYRSNVDSRPASASTRKAGYYYCGAFTGGTNLLASTVIYRVQTACGISAKVLMVTLQKERGLITKSSATQADYNVAMGYGCPDSSVCETKYYGLGNQVYLAANQFKIYALPDKNPFNFQKGVRYVQYDVDPACGGTNVNIQNWATAGLYNYTPYQPNAAAIAAYPGATSDPCGSYGNRNFFFFYSDWFGSPAAPHEGVTAIDQKHLSLGGDTGALGAAVGEISMLAANGGGLIRAFEGGAIAWSASRGAWAVKTGPIRTALGQFGGIDGSLGWPAGDETSYDVNGGGIVQAFQGGALVWSEGHGAHVIAGKLRTSLSLAGGITGPLGWPTAAEECAPDGTCTQEYLGGTAVWSPVYGYRSFGPEMYAKYQELGGVTGSLGAPAGEPNRLPEMLGGGVVQGFAGGAMAWSADNGAHVVTGNLRAALSAAGGLDVMGWPTTEQECDGDGICSQAFTEGTVMWSPNNGSYSFTTDMWNAYQDLGGSQGILKSPIAHPTHMPNVHGGGVVQAFQGGALVWSQAHGAFVVTGKVRTALGQADGIAGPLGWPMEAQECAPDGACEQKFIGGTVTWSPVYGHRSFGPGIFEKYQELDGAAGFVGVPTGEPTRLPDLHGGGTVQGFAGAAIVSTAEYGAFVVTGEVRTVFGQNGGLTGPLGWPIADQVCEADGSCSQEFMGGVVSWEPTNEGRVELN